MEPTDDPGETVILLCQKRMLSLHCTNIIRYNKGILQSVIEICNKVFHFFDRIKKL